MKLKKSVLIALCVIFCALTFCVSIGGYENGIYKRNVSAISDRMVALEVMMDEIISLQQSQKNDLMLVGKVMTLLATVVKESESSMIEGVSEAVLEAKSFINTHLSEPISLTDVASAVNLSPNYLHTVFKRSVGMTPRDYLTEKRLSLAAELLCTTSLPISEIAERCGFCNQQYLSGMFSKRFSLTPSAYRRKNVNDYLI